MEIPSGVEPAVLRGLRTAGDAGAGTLSAPEGTRQPELESFREAGSPRRGADGGSNMDDPLSLPAGAPAAQPETL